MWEAVFNLLPKWPLSKISLGNTGLTQLLLLCTKQPQAKWCKITTFYSYGFSESEIWKRGSMACLLSACQESRCGHLKVQLPVSQVPTCGLSSIIVSGQWGFFIGWLASPRVSIPRTRWHCMAFAHGASEACRITFAAFCGLGQSQTHLDSKGRDMTRPLNRSTIREFRVIFFKLPHILFQSLMWTHKLFFSLDILHICKVLTNTRARLCVIDPLDPSIVPDDT